MAQLFDVLRARLQAQPRGARPSIRLKPLLVAASAVAFLLTAAPRAEAAPVNTSPPAIGGVLEPEHTLTATTGTWKDTTSPIAGYEYQWLRCLQYECADIDYATSPTYTITDADDGEQLEVAVIATDAAGEFTVDTSEMTDVITGNGRSYMLGESVEGSGSVTGTSGGSPDANLACTGTCGESYPYQPGTRIELTAKPVPGATFEGWQGACSGSAPRCSVTLDGDEAVEAVFSDAAVTTPPDLPLGSEGTAGETQPGAGPSGEAWEAPAPSTRGLRARLLRLRGLGNRVQASVECLQAQPCRLTLGIFAKTPSGQAEIAQRSFTVAAGRSARIALTLSRRGERLLARRRRLLVTARLTLGAGGRAALVGHGRLTLAS